MAGSPSAWLRLTFISLLRDKEAVFQGHSHRNPPWAFQHLHTGFNSDTSHHRLNHVLPIQGFFLCEADGYLNVFTATLWHSGKIHFPKGLNCARFGVSLGNADYFSSCRKAFVLILSQDQLPDRGRKAAEFLDGHGLWNGAVTRTAKTSLVTSPNSPVVPRLSQNPRKLCLQESNCPYSPSKTMSSTYVS